MSILKISVFVVCFMAILAHAGDKNATSQNIKGFDLCCDHQLDLLNYLNIVKKSFLIVKKSSKNIYQRSLSNESLLDITTHFSGLKIAHKQLNRNERFLSQKNKQKTFIMTFIVQKVFVENQCIPVLHFAEKYDLLTLDQIFALKSTCKKIKNLSELIYQHLYS